MRLAEKKESLRTTNTTNPHPILQKPGVLENDFFSTLQEKHLICFNIFCEQNLFFLHTKICTPTKSRKGESNYNR